MRLKNKTDKFSLPALAALVWLLAFPPGLGAEGGGGLSAFSGHGQLREAVWRLAAFVPAGSGDGGEERALVVSGVKGLPPVWIRLTFGEPLDPWPERLELSFQAEAGDVSGRVTISDRRPFGGPNLAVETTSENGSVPRETADRTALLLEILTGLNQRLTAARPRLGPVEWLESAPGFELARVELLYGARLGPADLFLARFDPALFTFRPYHESEFPGETPVDVGGWAARLVGASALINGGQYYPDRTYMGTLSREGRDLSPAPHPQWKGLVVSGLRPGAPAGAPAAAVIDLQHPGEAAAENYLNVMQSFMLLDQKGAVRVRNSHNLAGRAAVGQDRDGRIVLIMTPAAVTLYDLALALKSPVLGLEKVMGLDGGFETQLLLRQNGSDFLSAGLFSISEKRALFLPGFRQSLPAVLAVERRPETAAEGGEGAESGADAEPAP